MTIECVTLETNHLFDGNPIAEQHKLRYRSIIQRQGWEVPTIRNLEFDQYDNPATTYLIWRDYNGIARGVSRLYPTDRPYMLKEVFPKLAENVPLPSSVDIWEGTRFCVDKGLDAPLRKRIIQEIILGYLEYGLQAGIKKYVGIMLPIYWNNIFEKNGWKVSYWSDVITIDNGDRIRSGEVEVSEENLALVRKKTGINESIINYGKYEGEYANNRKAI
ncbi:MAG: acyl-homoserine-lactone synthase [Rickettsiales bacterium]|nr:acyl-homoserine-lactone synthase [Rickettsiales bacterium]